MITHESLEKELNKQKLYKDSIIWTASENSDALTNN